MQAKEGPDGAQERGRPLLMVDIDGVISLFGGGWVQQRWPWGGRPSVGLGEEGSAMDQRSALDARPVAGSFHSIDGTPHFLSSTAAVHLLELSSLFELVWASGWEERANEHLPRLLGLPAAPFLRFARTVARANAHWKLEAIDAYAGARPLAWVDDALGEACEAWARARAAPTLLVKTQPELGLTEREASRLAAWARAL